MAGRKKTDSKTTSRSTKKTTKSADENLSHKDESLAAGATDTQSSSAAQADSSKQEKSAEAEKAPKAKKETAEKTKKSAEQSAPQPQKLALKDAANRFIENYRSHWYDSLSAFAKNQGVSDPATAEEYKKLFRRWGAKIKK